MLQIYLINKYANKIEENRNRRHWYWQFIAFIMGYIMGYMGYIMGYYLSLIPMAKKKKLFAVTNRLVNRMPNLFLTVHSQL